MGVYADMMTSEDMPEEDKLLHEEQRERIRAMELMGRVAAAPSTCQHEYIDLYCGWGPAKSDKEVRLVWMVCKRCLDKKQIRLSMHNVDTGDDEDEDDDNSD